MRRRVVLLALAVTMSACAYGRSAADLRDTTFGRMAAPAGSALAFETYTPAQWNIDGPLCADLERTYASNDARAFQAAVVAIGRDRHAQYVIAAPRPIYDDDLPGYSAGVHVSSVDGTSATVDFHDLDDPDYHAPSWIDARAWRFVIRLRIGDESGCHL